MMPLIALTLFFFFPDIVGFIYRLSERMKGEPPRESLRNSKRPGLFL